MGRANDAQKAARLNRARALLGQFEEVPAAVERLARDCSISPRQAYRYVQQAQRLKEPIPVSESKLAFHGKAPTQFDSAGAVVRICQKDVNQRSRDSSAASVPATRGRSWLSRGQPRRDAFNWSIVLIACHQTSWLRHITYSCLNGGEQSKVRPLKIQPLRR